MWDISNSASSLRTRVQDSIRSLVHAGSDACSAWAVAPNQYAYVTRESQRPFTKRERLRAKYQTAKAAFQYSVLIGGAPVVFIRHMGKEGLLANLLHVIEVLHRVRPEAQAHVDWTLVGNETGFRYGSVGSDVWSGLFRPIRTGSRSPAFPADYPVDLTLWGTGRDYLNGKALQNQRNAYHQTIAKWIEITNQNVLSRTYRTQAEFFAGRFCLGVHRRVGNAGVANLQRDGRVPSINTLLTRCDELLQTSGRSDATIFLATDDADAVDAFEDAFGARLFFQPNVKRTIASKSEVHFGDWQDLSLADAEDVLVDTLLLSRCDLLLHASSSVSTMASFLNPNLTLIRVYEAAGN